jgi:hypothetical protein
MTSQAAGHQLITAIFAVLLTALLALDTYSYSRAYTTGETSRYMLASANWYFG